ncbi:MAG: SusC/RagA family TonB-linked outer membrane protein [Capnocytophaga felis]|nr:SusC/RagA family TonB-linked outer membrane protein [Capnocytophaga felis]
MKEKLIWTVSLFLLALQFAFAQEKTITGTVKDEGGVPLPGVTVTVKGTIRGVATDFEGNYTIKAKVGDILHFLGIGLKSVDRAVSASTGKIDVTMVEEAEELGEVVVTAMGVSRSEKSLGYATQKVKASELTQAANTNMATALQGKVSGIEITQSSGMPGSSSKITIRGARSFTGNNAPLYVIDGMPVASTADVGTGNSVSGSDYANRAIDIDPNDIEDIQILKGQAASALYGMRASNGVILITTKSGKGKIGKPEFTFNSSVSFENIATLPKLQKEFAQGSGGKYNPNTSLSWGPKIEDLVNDPNYGGNTDNKYTQQFGQQSGKYYVPQRANAGLDPWAVPSVYDNVGEFFRVGYNINHSFSVVQGLEKGSYSFALGNTTTQGIVPSTEMSRTTAKLAGELKLSENWATGFSGNYITSHIAKQTGANNGIVATVFPAPPSYDLKGIPSHYKGDPYRQNTYRSTGGFDGAYWAVQNNSFTEDTQRFFGNAFAKFNTNFNTHNHKLDLKYQLGADAYTTKYDDVWGYGHSNGKGEIESFQYTIQEINSLLTASYNWKISDSFTFDALLGNEFIHTNTRYLYGYGKDFNFPGWNHLRNASIYKADNTYRQKRTMGFFGNANFSYRDFIFLGVTARQDVVSTMPRGNRTFFYPSTSLGVVLTEIPAFKNNVLTFAKLRASYAEVGQAGTYLPSYYSTPIYGGGFSSGTPITYPIAGVVPYTLNRTVYDPDLKPQNTKSYELGADLTFFGGLVDISYTYSRQDVKDQIFTVPLAGSTGSSNLMTNGGAVHTNVHEATLSLNPVRRANVKWNMAFNFSKIDNYVDQLAEGVESIFLGGFVEPQVRAGIGYKFPVIYGVGYLRNDAGQIVVDEKGIPQEGKEEVIGTVSPDFRLGLTTSLEVHKFKLSAVFDWKNGGQMYHGTNGLLGLYGISQQSADFRKADTFMFPLDAVKVTKTDAQGNPIEYAPNDIQIKGSDAQQYFSALNNISESNVFNTSFVKLREVSLSYPFLLKEKGLSITANIFARNFILWSELEGFDPEVSQGNTNMAGAFERFSLPGVSSYGLGINVKF